MFWESTIRSNHSLLSPVCSCLWSCVCSRSCSCTHCKVNLCALCMCPCHTHHHVLIFILSDMWHWEQVLIFFNGVKMSKSALKWLRARIRDYTPFFQLLILIIFCASKGRVFGNFVLVRVGVSQWCPSRAIYFFGRAAPPQPDHWPLGQKVIPQMCETWSNNRVNEATSKGGLFFIYFSIKGTWWP